MQLQHEEYEEPEINLTSLIDVVFLLLIFFMVSTTFERQTLLKVDLPEAATAESRQVPERVELIVSADGRVFLDEQLLADTRRETMKAALAEVFTGDDERILVIRADSEAPHGLVVRAMDAASQQGIERLSIATTPDGDP